MAQPAENYDQSRKFVEVAESDEFKSFVKKRKNFIIPYTIFFLVFYFLLPILTSYTQFLNTPAFGDISWVWVFATGQFIMTFALCTVYVRRASKFDDEAEAIIEHQFKEGGPKA